MLTRLKIYLALGAVCLTSAVLMITSILDESPTADEPVHLLSGYLALKDGNFSVDPEHPFLGKELNALPLLFLKPKIDYSHSYFQASQNFFYDARREAGDLASRFVFLDNDAKKLMLWGRIPSIIGTILLIVLVFFITRRFFGDHAALVSAAFLAFQPNIIAHGRLINTDIWTTLTIFLAGYLFYLYSQKPTRSNALFMGATVGLAEASKFSALFLWILLPTLLFVKSYRDRKRWLDWFLAFGTAIFLLWASYGFHFGVTENISRFINQKTDESYYSYDIAALPLGFLSDYIKGVFLVLRDNLTPGRESFVLGQVKESGSWYYFPFTWIVKTPIPEILALFLTLFLVNIKKGFLKQRRLIWFLLPPAILLLLALRTNINLGIRHILPIEPYLAFFIGWGAQKAFSFPFLPNWASVTYAALVVFQVANSFSAHPNYIAYFNGFITPDNAYKYLSDSNIDWGQDVYRLKKLLAERGINEVYLEYFWTWRAIDYAGIKAKPLSEHNQPEEVVVINVSNLIPGYFADKDYSWLTNYKPTARAGYSINIYDFRN